jgi:hypothetical protein
MPPAKRAGVKKAAGRKAAAPAKKAAASKKAATSGKAATATTTQQTTITLRHIAAGLAKRHDLSKRQAEAVLGDLVATATQHRKKGNKIPSDRPRHPTSGGKTRSDGPQPCDRGGNRHRRSVSSVGGGYVAGAIG